MTTSAGKNGDKVERKSDKVEKCGFWTKYLVNKKTFVLLFGLSGCFLSSTFSYFNGTITTMEKRFKMASKTTGIISIGNDVTKLLTSVVLNYYASKGHRPKWLSFGLLCITAFCFINTLPHLIYGPGEDALQLTFEYGSSYENISSPMNFKNNLCSVGDDRKCTLEEGSIVPPIIWFISQFIFGIGGVLFYSLGYSYLDDNVKKSKSPAVISFTYIIRLLGPSMGYAVVSLCLKLYISPNLTPTINNSDPRWLGAWWLGWLFLGTVMIIFAILMSLIPKTLPRAAARKLLEKNEQVQAKPSFEDLSKTVKRIISNPAYVFTQISVICHIFGLTPFRMFFPKYIETQYKQSASIASFVTGSTGLLFTTSGLILAGLVIQKIKPRARCMALWNTFIDSVTLIGVMSFLFLGCDQLNENMPSLVNHELNSSVSCSDNCDCDNVKFSPVCFMNKSQTFASPCHAGCTEFNQLNNGSMMYSNCSCLENFDDYLISGPCKVDCMKKFYIFVTIICIMKFARSLGRMTSFLLSIRCVDEGDKSVSLGIHLGVVSLFAQIPGPIFTGYVIDSTCLFWGKTCTGSGNCFLFDAKLMRERLVYMSICFLSLEVFSDIGIWWNVKNLKIFDKK